MNLPDAAPSDHWALLLTETTVEITITTTIATPSTIEPTTMRLFLAVLLKHI